MRRPQLAPIAADTPRDSRKVKTVAAILEVDASQVRDLIEAGELESHTVGKRGVRVYLDSVADYQRREARKATRATPEQEIDRRRRSVSRAAHRAALTILRAEGILS